MEHSKFKSKSTEASKHMNLVKQNFFKITCCILLLVNLFPAQIFSSNNPGPSRKMVLRLEVNGFSMQNETAVYFDSAGSFFYDPLVDAPSLGTSPGYVNIVTRFDSIDYQIKCLPTLTESMIIPIKITTGTTGQYLIYANEVQNLPSGACVILYDHYLNNSRDIRTGGYLCTLSDTETVARFSLYIVAGVFTPVSGNIFNPTCSSSKNGKIIANVNGSGPWNYYWKDSLNNIIKTSFNKNTPDTLNNVNAGFYRVDINPSGTCDNGTLYFTLEGSLSSHAAFVADTITDLYTDVTFTNTSTHADAFWWDFGDGSGNADTNTVYNYASTGTYTVTLSAYSYQCNDTSVYSRQITVAGTTAINQKTKTNNNMLISRDEGGWYSKFNYSSGTDAVISVSNITGQNITEITTLKNVTNEKVYINVAENNSIVFIKICTSAGEMIYKKLFL